LHKNISRGENISAKRQKQQLIEIPQLKKTIRNSRRLKNKKTTTRTSRRPKTKKLNSFSGCAVGGG
jgi:hypothetical protein